MGHLVPVGNKSNSVASSKVATDTAELNRCDCASNNTLWTQTVRGPDVARGRQFPDPFARLAFLSGRAGLQTAGYDGEEIKRDLLFNVHLPGSFVLCALWLHFKTSNGW